MNYLVLELMHKGYVCSVLAGLMPGGYFALRCRVLAKINDILFDRRLARDTLLGYNVWRTWFPWGGQRRFPDRELEYVISKEKPDLVVVASGEAVRIAKHVKNIGIPILLWLVDVEFQDHGGSLGELGVVPCIANSLFTAEKHNAEFGVSSTVIHPLIPRAIYKTKTSREKVTFVNASRHKGLDIALEIARACPEIPFEFVGGMIPPRGTEVFARQHDVPRNVALTPAERDMRDIYSRCKILLVPSVWEEGYGRIVTEAQISGIPCIASRRGGLPEAVGGGGILLDPKDPIETWVTALRRLWEDERLYDQLSSSALAHSQRVELDWSSQVGKWEQAVVRAVKKAVRIDGI
jgi:glycosyltransferase involved in cell wall biosynthesis